MIYFLFAFINLIPKINDTAENPMSKYEQVLTYISTDSTIKQSIFYLLPSVHYRTIDSIFVSEKIYFIDFFPFCSIIHKKDSICDLLRSNLGENEMENYKKENFFQPIEIHISDKINKNKHPKLALYFSKSKNNFLIAVATAIKGNSPDYDLDTNFGEIIKFIFFFDKNTNKISRVFQSNLLVN